MKKILIALYMFVFFAFTFVYADFDAYKNTLEGRRIYVKKGLADISSYVGEPLSSPQKQSVTNTTNTAIFEISELIDKSESYLNEKKSLNMTLVKSSIDKKVKKFSVSIKKYSTADLTQLFKDFDEGMQNVYNSNFSDDNSSDTIDIPKQSKYYNKIYSKLQEILKNYPGGSYKSFLDKLSDAVYRKKQKILKRKISDEKKSKYIMMYEMLELAIKDFQS